MNRESSETPAGSATVSDQGVLLMVAGYAVAFAVFGLAVSGPLNRSRSFRDSHHPRCADHRLLRHRRDRCGFPQRGTAHPHRVLLLLQVRCEDDRRGGRMPVSRAGFRPVRQRIC